MIYRLNVTCSYDIFHDKLLLSIDGDVRVHEIRTLAGEISDSILVRLRDIMSEHFDFDPGEKNVWDAVRAMAYDNRFDPISDMLDEAEGNWDGKPRLDKWVSTYLGCEDTELNSTIGHKVLVAAVRRVRSPGCKFDNITVLEGPEGRNKSTAIRILAGDENFSDQSILGAKDREIQEQLSGIWMHENADLVGMKKADVEHVKAFLSRTNDRVRPAYGKTREDRPRRSIEWGTTNPREYLQSPNGNRRFWPLEVGFIDVDALKRDRFQLLGEAARCEKTGESLLMDEGLWPAVGDAQEKRRTKDPWEDILENIPDTSDSHNSFGVQILHNGDGKERVKSSDLLTYVLHISPGNQVHYHTMRLSHVMKSLGWERNTSHKVTIDGVAVNGWWRKVKTGEDHVEPLG
jgi:predicted P-loop ATPase